MGPSVPLTFVFPFFSPPCQRIFTGLANGKGFNSVLRCTGLLHCIDPIPCHHDTKLMDTAISHRAPGAKGSGQGFNTCLFQYRIHTLLCITN